MSFSSRTALVVFCLTLTTTAVVLAAESLRQITVRGTCLKSIIPDRGSVVLYAKHRDKNAGTAVAKATEIYNKLLEKAKALGLKNVAFETSEYNLHEEFDWSNNKKTSLGFIAKMGLLVSTSEIARLGEVIKIGADLNLEEGGGLSTFVSDARLKEEREACLEEATKNARSKAERMAKGAGVKLGKTLLLNEEGTNQPTPRPIYPASLKGAIQMRSMEESAPADIQAKEQKLTVNIEASYLIE